MIYLQKRGTTELDHVHLDTLCRQAIEQLTQDQVRVVEVQQCTMDQINSNNAQCLLLADIVGVEHAHMNDNLTGF